MIVTIIPTDLVTNSLLSSFCSYLQTKNKDQVFSRLVVWYREIFLLFVYSKSRSTSKPCQIQQTFTKEFSQMFSCSYLVPWFKYKNIIMVKTVTLYKNFFFLKSLKSFKSKKKKLVLPLFYHVSREIWLGNSKEFVQTNQDSTFSHTCEISKLFNIFLFLLKFYKVKERQIST